MVCSALFAPSTLSRANLLFKSFFPRYTSRPLSIHSRGTPLRRRPLFSPPSSALPCSNSLSVVASSTQDDLVVLGIETSCDDTAAAVVRSDGEILSQVVSSQADLLVRYGGVAPKMAEEEHSRVIDQVVHQALENANLLEKDLSAVAVTIGPGLSLCLRVGVQKARKIAGLFSLPIIGVHHMEAHALVARLTEKDLKFPFLALLISGGHNLLILAHELGHYIQLGTTIDDAIGEAYDKTARWLGLDLRKGGGPALEQLAREGDANSVKFSIPMRQHKDCNFSYAGLKTQVRMAIESLNVDMENNPISFANAQDRRKRADIAASFQRVAVLHLEERCERAIEWALKIEPSIKYLVVSGGVASNNYVRTRLDHIVDKHGLRLICPPPSLCTDNGVMVAWTGIEHFRFGRFDPPPPASEPEDFVGKPWSREQMGRPQKFRKRNFPVKPVIAPDFKGKEEQHKLLTYGATNRQQEQLICKYCGRKHLGECRRTTGECFRCGAKDHRIKDCLKASETSQPRVMARVFNIYKEDVEMFGTMVEATILISDFYFRVLFDPGATDSFISEKFAKMLKHQYSVQTVELLSIYTPVGRSSTSQILHDVRVVIKDKCMHVDLYVLNMEDFDMILGMDWLGKNFALLDCRNKKIVFQTPGQKEFSFQCPKGRTSKILVSSIKARRLLNEGCQGYLVSVITQQKIEGSKGMVNIEVVEEFLDVLPDDLPRLPPSRELKFSITLVPGWNRF